MQDEMQPKTISGFGLVNKSISKDIYGQLINGRVINRSKFEDGELRPNRVFEELLNNLDHYRQLYEAIGFELVMREGFAYIRSIDAEDKVEEAVRRVQALLLVLFRGVTELGFQMDILRHDQAGLSNLYIDEIGKGEDKIDVLHACGMKGETLASWVYKTLELRAIAYRNAKGNLVLSEAGVAFFNELLGEGDITN
jgi:hypothetical protein